MLRRSLGICFVLSALTVTIAGAAGSPPPTEITRSPGGSVGPALSGATVIWASPTNVYSARGGHQHAIWQAPPVGIPPDMPLSPDFLDKRIEREVEFVAASPAMTAFVASATLREGLSCEPRCVAPPALLTPIFFALLVGPPEGPFVRVEGERKPCSQAQWLARKIDVAGSSVVVSETPRSCRQDAPRTPSRVVLIDRGRGRTTRTVLARSNDGYFDHVALTPQYAAWEEHRDAPAKSTITVYDRSKRRAAYRMVVDSQYPELDLQRDGTLVVASDTNTLRPCGSRELSLASRARPRLRPLGAFATGYKVRVAGGAVVYTRIRSCENPMRSELVVRRLGGSTTVVAGDDRQLEPLLEGFDFDGERVAYFATVFGADGKRQFFALYVARVR